MEKDYNGLEIAVIGISAKFPKSSNVATFWENLKEGKEMISFFSDEELKEAGIGEKLIQNPNYIKANGYIEDSNYFDATFFGYSPDEAEVMDPQIRHFYEQSWKAMEDAAIVPDKFKGLIGLYAGATSKFDWTASKFIEGKATWESSQLINKDHLATRVAYKLNLKGPAITMYTACSTSLVTINSACFGLLTGQCDVALAGGVTISPEKKGYMFEEGMISSPDGHNRTFDEKAAGTVAGSGVGVVVLKRLDEAIEQNDHIYAIIKGFAINNDGNRKVGFTAPSIEGQAEAIRSAMQMAEVSPESISFVECHGTATNLGDPVEVEGLKLAFDTEKRNFCSLGSVKSNTGHLDSAAGVAGFIKTALCLKNKTLVPSLHFKNPNPKMELDKSPFNVNTQTKQWINNKYPLRAGVSSFGVGGTNAHSILEEPPLSKTYKENGDFKILTITGKSKKALENNTENLVQHLKNNEEINLSDVAYTLNIGREHFPFRRAIVCKNIADIESVQPEAISPVHNKRNTVFMFSGQGAQYVNMGKDLYNKIPYFKTEFDKCSESIINRLGFDIREILFSENENDINKIDQVLFTQPIKFSFEYCLAKLLINLGIEPDYLIGHSFGEVGVACLSGVFSFDDAIEVVAMRAELMESVAPGLMMSVNLPEEKLKEYLVKFSKISLAAVNGEEICIVSGTTEDINELEKIINEDGNETIILKVPRAGHSEMMEPIMGKYKDRIAQMNLNSPQTPYISGLTGTWIKTEQATDADYWSRHLRETIRFYDGIGTILEKGEAVFIQLGSDRGLTSFAEIHEKNCNKETVVNLIRHKKEIIDDHKFLTNQLANIWLKGAKVDWNKFYKDEKRKKISLPTYEFDKQKFEARADLNSLINKKLGNLGDDQNKRRMMSEWFYLPSWEHSALLSSNHKVENENILVFRNKSNISEKVVKNLEKRNANITEIYLSNVFEIVNESNISINANNEDFEKIKHVLIESNKKFHKIIHLWSSELISRNEEVSDCEVNKGYKAITYIVKELIETLERNAQIISITVGSYDIYNTDQLCPERTMVGTALKVLGQEHPGIYTKLLDIDEYTIENEGGIKDILTDIYTQSKEKVVAYRYGKRMIESYKALDMQTTEKSNLLKTNGVYLITGGLGNIGLDIAEYLAKEYKAKIILIGRRDFPKPEEWESFLNTNGDKHVISKKINAIKGIKDSGGEVRIYKTDIGDYDKFNSVFELAKNEFQEINGIFHLAGNTNQDHFVPLSNMTDEITENHFKPKIHGFNTLKQILRNHQIDFCFLTSSVSSILGGIEFGAYACSNAYMDTAVAAEAKYRDNPWINVNLDGWISRRSEIEVSEQSNSYVLTDEGTKLIENILSLKERGINSVVQSISDFNNRANKWITNLNLEGDDVKGVDSGKEEVVEDSYPRPDISSQYVEPRNEKEQRIAEIWCMFFRYDKIGIDDDFFELGGNSLKAMRLLTILYKEFGIRIKVKEMFKRPTIALIAEYINENIEEFVI